MHAVQCSLTLLALVRLPSAEKTSTVLRGRQLHCPGGAGRDHAHGLRSSTGGACVASGGGSGAGPVALPLAAEC